MKILFAILCIFLLVFSSIKYFNDRSYQEDLYKQASEYNENLRRLKNEKKEIEAKIEDLKSKMIVKDNASSIILLSDTNVSHFNDIVPLLDDYGLIGVIAIDDNNDPSQNIDNYLNLDQISSLLDKGYEAILTIDINSDINYLYDKYSQIMPINGYYCKNGDLSFTQIEDIKKTGKNVIFIENNTIIDEEILCIESIGSYSGSAKTYFNEGIEKSSIMAFLVGYSKKNEIFSKTNCESMIDKMLQEEENNRLLVTNVSGVIDRYKDGLNTPEINEITEEISKLSDRLVQIDEELIKY